jgi:competence protein ComEC
MPSAAAALWVGVLLEPILRGGVSPWVLLLVGLAGLAAAALATPRPTRGPAPLALAGLTEREPAQLETLASAPPPAARAPPVLALGAILALVSIGAGWAGLRVDRIQHSFLAGLAGQQVRATGELRSDPTPGAFGWSAMASLSEVEGAVRGRVHELVWFEGPGAPPSARRGDRFAASGLLERPTDPGFADYLLRKGAAVALRANTFRRLGPSSNPIVRSTQFVRQVLLGRVRAILPKREAGLLMGLALGDATMLDPADVEHFRATGLSHLLVVSGENVAMVLAPVLALSLLVRFSMRTRFLVGVFTVVFFVLLTGADPSVLRAGVMAVLALTCTLLGRPRSTAAILGGAVFILLLADPSLVSSVGFQLSVAATAGMVALASPIADRLRVLPRPIALAAGTTLAAQAGVCPLLLYYFHQVPEVTLLANVLAFPAVPAAMLLGLAAAGMSIVFQPIGMVLAKLAEIPLRYLEGLANHLASAPFPSITSPGGAGILVAGFGLVGAITWWLRSGRPLPRRAVVAAVAVVPFFVWATAIRAGPPSGLVVRFLDVGQGDAALVQSPGGANVLIDGGPDPQLVATDLAALGVKHLDAVVATHPHLDHYVGLAAVLARVPTSVVFDSGCSTAESHSGPYLDFLHAVHDEGIPEEHPTKGAVLTVGDLRFDVLSPDRCWQGTNSDPNNDSIVLLLTYRGDSVLFANEPEADAQQAMLDAHAPLTAEVLNVPHHGAGTSILPFFQAIHDAVAVVSVGPNTYGHPVPRTLQWLSSTGARVFRTDRAGDVVIRFEDPGIRVDTGRGRRFAFAT